MIKIISGSPQKIWVPVNPGATVFVGSIVSFDSTAEGVVIREQADGAADTTNKDVPFGVVTGTNRRTPLWNATEHAHYIVGEAVTAIRTSATEYVGVEGPWGKGDNRAMVQVELIDSSTILKAPFFDDAVGTALSVLTSTTGNASGLTVTTNECDFTPVANLATIYCRSGLNAGTYRMTTDTSTTVAVWDSEMLNTTATAGETYVRAPVRVGRSYVRIGDDTVSSYINASETQATNYDIIWVIHLDLSTAGEEFCLFRFDGDHFCSARA